MMNTSRRWKPCRARSPSHGRKKTPCFRLKPYGNIAPEALFPRAFAVVPDIGHVPMLDDPKLVARTILAVTGAAKK